MMTDHEGDRDSQITSIADAVVKLKELKESNKNLNEPDIEERFARLSLTFKTDASTLGQRLRLQRRQRDVAERNIEEELGALRDSLNALHQLCDESEMRDLITKTQQHVDIVQRATLRMSSRAETYGAIQQEHRLNCAFECMLNYLEHLKLMYDREHMELEEYRRLLAEHNLLPPTTEEDTRRVALPPRSQSLSSSSKPEFLRRGSGSIFPRPPEAGHIVVRRENSAGHLTVRQKNTEARTRLLSAVCLLSNNFDSQPRSSLTAPLSPKSRRSSLPVGPSTTVYQTTHRTVTHNNERTESYQKSAKSDESHCQLTEPENLPSSEEEPGAEGTLSNESSSNLTPDPLSPAANPSAPEPSCDDAKEEVGLLPEIRFPVKSKSLSLTFITPASDRFSCTWASSMGLQQLRYTLSAMLATAAMLALVLTFMPNQTLA